MDFQVFEKEGFTKKTVDPKDISFSDAGKYFCLVTEAPKACGWTEKQEERFLSLCGAPLPLQEDGALPALGIEVDDSNQIDTIRTLVIEDQAYVPWSSVQNYRGDILSHQTTEAWPKSDKDEEEEEEASEADEEEKLYNFSDFSSAPSESDDEETPQKRTDVKRRETDSSDSDPQAPSQTPASVMEESETAFKMVLATVSNLVEQLEKKSPVDLDTLPESIQDEQQELAFVAQWLQNYQLPEVDPLADDTYAPDARLDETALQAWRTAAQKRAMQGELVQKLFLCTQTIEKISQQSQEASTALTSAIQAETPVNQLPAAPKFYELLQDTNTFLTGDIQPELEKISPPTKTLVSILLQTAAAVETKETTVKNLRALYETQVSLPTLPAPESLNLAESKAVGKAMISWHTLYNQIITACQEADPLLAQLPAHPVAQEIWKKIEKANTEAKTSLAATQAFLGKYQIEKTALQSRQREYASLLQQKKEFVFPPDTIQTNLLNVAETLENTTTKWNSFATSVSALPDPALSAEFSRDTELSTLHQTVSAQVSELRASPEQYKQTLLNCFTALKEHYLEKTARAETIDRDYNTEGATEEQKTALLTEARPLETELQKLLQHGEKISDLLDARYSEDRPAPQEYLNAKQTFLDAWQKVQAIFGSAPEPASSGCLGCSLILLLGIAAVGGGAWWWGVLPQIF
jgi:hypothetical protein